MDTGAANTVSTRIPATAFQAATGVLFGIAIIAWIFRLYVQIKVRRGFGAEDWVLLFAVATLIANTTLCYLLFPRLYRSLEVTLGAFNAELIGEVIEEIPVESAEANAIATLWWFTIYPVKFAYLLFFRKLIARMKHLIRYWWFTTAFMVVGLIACIVADWQVCHYTSTVQLLSHCAGNQEGRRAVKATIATTVFDVLSDLFVASIPVCLLWRVRISTRQKVGLSMVLCLSLVMVVVSFVRIGGMHLSGGEVDVVWLSFWQQNECNIAVWMVSMTSFRSFFVARRHGEGAENRSGLWPRLRQKLSHYMPWLFSKRQPNFDDEPYEQERSGGSDRPMIQSNQPAIPAATISGVRTAIGKAGDHPTTEETRQESHDSPG